MDGIVGQTLTRELTLTLNGAPLTTATVTYTLYAPTGVVLRAAVAVPHVGGGVYRITNDGSTYLLLAGLYHEAWAVLDAGVDDYPTDAWFYLDTWRPGLHPRWELRHRVARALRDLTAGTATGGSPTTLADTERWEPDDHWNGATLYLYAGTGRGQERRVTDFAGGVLTVGTAWSPTPVAGTQYELHQRYDVDAYNQALNRAIDGVRGRVVTEVVDDSLVTDVASYEYTIPAHLQFLRGVLWRADTDTAGVWAELSYHAGDWCLLPGRRLRLAAPTAAVGTLRLVGETVWQDLDSDDSLTAGPTEYLVWRAGALLLAEDLRSAAQDPGGHQTQLAYFDAQAGQLLPRMRNRPNARRVL